MPKVENNKNRLMSNAVRDNLGRFIANRKSLHDLGLKCGCARCVKRIGNSHPAWKGGRPKCWCGKQLSRYNAKNCVAHSFTPERIARIKKGREGVIGPNHPNWKGIDVGYRGLHRWIEKTLGKPKKCAFCGVIGEGHKMHWANISRTYKRNSQDWIRLCAKCHKAFDRKPKTESQNH